MGGVWTQLFPPSPLFTEKNLPPLQGKVIIVTGGNSGIGLEIVSLLYEAGARVYIASRSKSRIDTAISQIKESLPTANGDLRALVMDLADLRTIAPAVDDFLTAESRLDLLFNNAGISQMPAGSTTVQGHEVHMGVNCLSPFLLTKLLSPILQKTAANSGRDQVRVIFTSSGIIDMSGPPGGLCMAEVQSIRHGGDKNRNYSTSKAGDWFLASEFDKRLREHGIICLAHSPGTIATKGWDNASWLMKTILKPFMHEPRKGAYTGLWCGFSPQISCADGGRFAVPWGRWHPSPNKDILESLKTRDEGGTGLAAQFWKWCEATTHVE